MNPLTIFLYSYFTSEKDEDEHIQTKECVMHVRQVIARATAYTCSVALWVPLADAPSYFDLEVPGGGISTRTINLGQKNSKHYNSDRDSVSSS